jgi:phytoene desaturase
VELAHRARALVAQIEGWVGGWVSSRQNHLGWRDAPFERLAAELVELLGTATGKVPEAVRSALHWNTFQDFCRFNRAAETTAALAWRRMAELAESIGAHEDVDGFLRMAGDEERHARLFGILARAIDEHDHLTITADALEAELEAVGQRFVARPGGPARRNPLGKGGSVIVREGEDAARVVAEVFEAMGMDALLDAHRPSDRPVVVALKSTFMLVTDRDDPSPGVSMRVLRATVGWLRERGAAVCVLDAGNLYDRFHAHRSVAEVAAYLGLEEPVIDAHADQVSHEYVRGMDVHTVCESWRDADVRLLLGKLRSHPTATALLSIDAAEGLGARVDDHLFSDRRAERETAVLMALDALPPHAALLDAWEHVPDGLLGMFGTESPLHPRRIYASTDAVALDALACAHIGGDPARDGTLLMQAFDWFGDPRAHTVVDGPDAPIEGFRLADHSARTALLAELALPVFTHASLRGELFLPDFDEQAFPPIEAPSVAVRAARAALRVLVDDAPRDAKKTEARSAGAGVGSRPRSGATHVIVIGAGVGGLCAAIALRRRGHEVTVLEAREVPGGLAGGFDVEGRSHDGGPYILLDRPGLEWAFERLGLRLLDHVEPIPLDEVYRVRRPSTPDVRVYRDLDRTAQGLAEAFGAREADRYVDFVRRMTEIHAGLEPLQREPHAGARGLLMRGLIREGLFLLRGLDHHLRASGLPEPVRDALGIWTHIAGQPLAEAPAPLAFVPALVHGAGAYSVRGGMRRIPDALHRVAIELGVELRLGTPVARIVRKGRRVTGVETASGEHLTADVVFSNAPGIATYTRLLDPPDERMVRDTESLSLQSPGVAAYLHAEVRGDVPFLQFWLPGGDEKCRVLVHAGAVDDTRRGTLRLVSPTDHGWAARAGADGQRALLDRLMDEPWWREGVTEMRVVASRTPVEWGRDFHLWRDSMNPTMTAAFMRQGRLAPASPAADNLFLCGSATHPGQWVSFCAISGVLAAERVLEDLG